MWQLDIDSTRDYHYRGSDSRRVLLTVLESVVLQWSLLYPELRYHNRI